MRIQDKISIVLVLLVFSLSFFNTIEAQDNVWDKSWTSCQKTPNPIPEFGNTHWLLYEFHERQSIKELHFWNANKSGQSAQGVKKISIDYKDDSGAWQNLGLYDIPQAPESDSYAGFQGPSFESEFVTNLLVTVLSTYGDGTCASIAELKINIDTEVCYGIEDECGVCDGPGQQLWYRDADADGLGDLYSAIYNCTAPTGYVDNYNDECDNGILGWSDVGAIFEENGCLGCHDAGGAGGLDLTSYATFVNGGNKCGSNILEGTTLVDIIQIPGYDGCGDAIGIPNMNARVGDALDDQEIALLAKWISDGAPEYCKCPDGALDSDLDGVCDAMDFCPTFDNRMIGTPCDDGDPCTGDDQYAEDCNCVGLPLPDSDGDGVCDEQDIMPNDPCTADGVIDGVEPYNWNGTEGNDCDGDGINIAQGDINDFQACIDDKGFLNTANCICEGETLDMSGRYVSAVEVWGTPEHAAGLPDGVLGGGIRSSGGKMEFQFPYMRKGEEVCITIAFEKSTSGLSIGMNDLGNYHIYNYDGPIDYVPVEYCVKAIEDAPQLVTLKNIGSGNVRIDGTRYNYCPCSPTDPFYNSPQCACPDNEATKSTTFVAQEGLTDAELAAGMPDGIVTGKLGYNDYIDLSFGDLSAGTKICFTLGFQDSLGRAQFELSDFITSFSNEALITDYGLQEFCFAVPNDIPDAVLRVSEFGSGGIKVDGSIAYYCSPCETGDPDTDQDGVCDANDRCPLSANNDSDGDGICDDLDICPGFDDLTDSDDDGIPDGCDICAGAPDQIDSDFDGVPDACDLCEGSDDRQDSDGDGLPDGCDSSPCLNFVSDVGGEMVMTDRIANINIRSNGVVPSNMDILFKAGHSIDFNLGFYVEESANFEAIISVCPE